MASLAGLLATCIAVDAFFIGCEVLTVAYPQTAGGAQLLGEMFSGATAPFFWFEVAAGLIVPFCILVFAKNRQRTGLVMGASVLVVLGVLCKRIWLLFTSFIHPNMAGAPASRQARASPHIRAASTSGRLPGLMLRHRSRFSWCLASYPLQAWFILLWYRS